VTVCFSDQEIATPRASLSARLDMNRGIFFIWERIFRTSAAGRFAQELFSMYFQVLDLGQIHGTECVKDKGTVCLQ